MRVGVAQHLESLGQERITGEDRGCLVELAVGRGLAATQIVIVHRRQVVMHQRIGMHHLDGGGGAQGAVAAHAEQVRRGHHEKGPEPLAADHDGVAHGVEEA